MKRRAAFWLATTGALLALPAPALSQGRPDIDRRPDAGRVSPRATVLADTAPGRSELRRSLGRLGVVDVDGRTGTPRVVARLDGFLTAESDRPPADIALGFVREHADAFGLDAREIARLRLTRSYTDLTGVTHLAWEQSLDGVPVFGHGLVASVDARGRLVNVLGAPVAELRLRGVKPRLSAGAGLQRSFTDVRAARAAPRPTRSPAGPARRTEFAGGHRAQLAIVIDGPGRARLAWRTLTHKSSTEVYDHLVDATTGDVLLRSNAVDFVTGRVWEYAPGVDTVCAECLPAAGQQNNVTFPSDWSTGTTNLNGAYAHVYTDVNDDNAVDSPSASCPDCGEVPATAGNFNYEFIENPGGLGAGQSDRCAAGFPPCSWEYAEFGWTDNIRQNATQVYYFLNRFHDWLEGPPFGFTAASGNFEGADEVKAEILDGADTETKTTDGFEPHTPDEDHINNANMFTPRDGTPPRMQMYLFASYFSGPEPEVNGGDDASVVYHEYVHGLSNRLVTDPSGNPALISHQASAMGEGWSDWYAMDYLEANGFDQDDSPEPGEMNLGVYVQGGNIHSLRTMGLDCPVDTAHVACDNPGLNQAGEGGYTLGDMGRIGCKEQGTLCKPEEHDDGEIWGQTLWDLRQRLVAALGTTAGLQRARQIITNAMRLAPPDPSFIDMRNAILQAETIAGGQQFANVFDVFADRGMGHFAADLGPDDTAPQEDFSPLVDCANGGCGSLTGTVTDADTGGGVAGVDIELRGIGGLVATSGADGTFTVPNVPLGTYRYLVAAADGYDLVVARDVAVTGASVFNLTMKRNWASVLAGARVVALAGPDFSSEGCGPRNAFDQSLGTTWGSTAPEPSSAEFASMTGPKSVTLSLPRAVDVEKFAVDPAAGCGDDRSASTRDFRVETSTDGATFVTAAEGTFGEEHLGKLNDVAALAGTAGVRFIRFTMLSALGPIEPDDESYRDFMDVSEVAVYGKPTPSPVPPPAVQPPPPVLGPSISGLKVRKTRLRKLVRGKALSARLTVSGPGKVTARLRVARKTAFKLGLTRKRRGRPVTIARVVRVIRAAGTVTIKMKLSRKARKALKPRLRRVRSLSLTLNLVAADASGRNGPAVSKRLRVKR